MGLSTAFNDLLAVFGLIFALSLTIALAATPVARQVALRLGIVDVPTDPRKIHHNPMPYLGGVAIYVAFLAILWVIVQFGARNNAETATQLLAIVGGASLMALLGLWDDRADLPPFAKLIGQVLGAVILYQAGIFIRFNHFPWLDAPVTLVWVVGVTNAFNLLDNMDGLSVGIATIASSYFFLLAFLSSPTQFLVASLAAALAGACLGFLRYNFNPARIFMGDAGALFLGFLLAAIAMKLRPPNLHAVTFLIPILVLGLPIFDTTMVTISRLRRGVSPATAGRDHVSHRLAKTGLTTRETVMTLYLVCGVLGMSSLILTKATVQEGIVLAVAVLACGVWAFVQLEKVYYSQR